MNIDCALKEIEGKNEENFATKNDVKRYKKMAREGYKI